MKRPVLRWFGGKFRLAPWIIGHMPKHRVYVEPFGGAASVLLQKPRSYAEIYNDLDDSLWCLFSVLKQEDTAKKLKAAITATPYSRREFELAHVYHPDMVESARRLIVRSFMGFGADSASRPESKTGFRSNSNRSGTTPAHDWINYPKEIDAFCDRLRGVVIDHKPAIDVMKEHDSPETLFYVDPPYPHSTRRGGRYRHEMSGGDHDILLQKLSELKGKVMLSGYSEERYEQLGWRKEEKLARADGAGLRTECLWMNF